MVFFYLTNAALDISLGVVWWGVKNTTYLVYNGITYAIYGEDNKPTTEEILMHEISEIKEELKSLKMIKNK